MTGLEQSATIPLAWACEQLGYYCQHRDWLPPEWNGADAVYYHLKARTPQTAHCDAGELILAWREREGQGAAQC